MITTPDPYVADFCRSLLTGFVPKQTLSPNEWNEAYRQMEPGAAKSGRWRSFPFQIEPLNSIAEPEVRKVTFMWASQFLGKSAVITGQIGWLMDQQPTSVLMVHPTEHGANHFMRSRLNPLIQSTPALSVIVDSSKARKGVRSGLGGQQILRKTYPGGWLLAGGSNSPAQLRAHAARVTIFDETDAFEDHKEGDVLLLCRQRSATFPDSLSICASTPTFKGTSRIEAEYQESDQRKWFVSCPHCHQPFFLGWPHVVWDKEKDDKGETVRHFTETAHIVCPCCSKPWTEAQRIEAVRNGQWIATRPHIKSHRGYWLNALNVLSPCPKGRVSWMHELAERFLEAKRLGVAGIKTFVNLVLAETWAVDAERPPEYRVLYGRREEYPENNGELVLPEGVLYLTAGCDTQPDRVESSIIGWGEADEMWVIAHRIIYGDPAGNTLWPEVDNWLQRKWLHSSGQRLYPEVVLIDSGGHHAKEVYNYVFRCAPRLVFAGKGVRGYSPKFIARSQGTNARLYLIKVDAPKEHIYSKLKISEPGPGYMHFASNTSSGLDLQYFEQICSEEMKISIKLGQRIPYFEKISSHARNEALDCLVYALGAKDLISQFFPGGIDTEAIKGWLSSAPTPEPKEPEPQPVPAPKQQPTAFATQKEIDEAVARASSSTNVAALRPAPKRKGWATDIGAL